MFGSLLGTVFKVMLQRLLSWTTLHIPATAFSCSGVTASRLAGTTNAVAVRAIQRMRKASFIGVFIFFGFF